MSTNGHVARTDTVPIGPLQELLWLFWQLNPTSSAYNLVEIFPLDGDFDVAAGELAVNEQFVGMKVCVRRSTRPTPTSYRSWIVNRNMSRSPWWTSAKLEESVQTERLESTLDAEANRPFDLSAERAIRVTAIRLSGSRTVLVAVAHHISCDGASMGVFLDEFGALYTSARRGTPPELGPIAPGYSAFVKGQLAAIDEGRFREESEYWRERLAGVTCSALPGSGGAARTPGALAICVIPTTLDDELTDTLSAYARRIRSTPFRILLGAMNVMIAAATGDGDVALGMPTSARTPKFARTVGNFSNVVVARSRIDLSKTFAATLEEVSLDLMDAIDHRDLPFSRMVADLNAAGLRPGLDLVRTQFVEGVTGGVDLGEGTVWPLATPHVDGPFELVVSCHFEPPVIALDWEFALRSYTPDAARGYPVAYQEILAALLHQPDTAMDSLGLAEILDRFELFPRSDAPSADPMLGAPEPDRTLGGELTPVEEAVAAIWSELIGVPVDSPYDQFFDLGGHSLLAIDAIKLVRTRLSHDASVRLLFEHPQLRDFSSLLDVGDTTTAGQEQ